MRWGRSRTRNAGESRASLSASVWFASTSVQPTYTSPFRSATAWSDGGMQNCGCGGRNAPSQPSSYGVENDTSVFGCANVLPSGDRVTTSVSSSPSAAATYTPRCAAASESANGWGTGIRTGRDHVLPSSRLTRP